MKLVVQRVTSASVSVEGNEVSRIGKGLMILVGIQTDDTMEDVRYLAAKVPKLRIFDDSEGVMNLSAIDIGGEILCVSQFTLMASTKKGNRPSYMRAAGHELAIPLFEAFCKEISAISGLLVKKGVFGAYMQVDLINDGPVTIIFDSKHRE